MTQSLVAKLDQLHRKVEILAKALAESQAQANRNAEQLKAVYKENEQLRNKVEHAQGQINQMLNQWFPELELTTEEQNGDS